MTVPLVIKRAYGAISLFAVFNMLVLAGATFFLIVRGGIDSQKLRGIVTVLRGEQWPEQQTAATAVAQAAEAALPQNEASGGAASIGETQMKLEMLRREADRLQEELRQRLALNNAILLKVTTERDQFREEREADGREVQARNADLETEGFMKQVAIYESLIPKTALKHLLGLADPDAAARVLGAMSTRSARKIVEAAKDGVEMQRMMTILQRLKATAPERSAGILED